MTTQAPAFREKHVHRRFVGLMTAGAIAIALVAAISAIVAGRPLAALAPLPAIAIVALVALYFAVMRVAVTSEYVIVQYGTMGPRIPVAAISSVRLERHFGLGPKYYGGADGWVYGPLGTTEGVRVDWTDGRQKRSCYIGSKDPQGLLRAIDDARRAAAPHAAQTATGATGIRAEPNIEAHQTRAENDRADAVADEDLRHDRAAARTSSGE